jgi:hypothetical protein
MIGDAQAQHAAIIARSTAELDAIRDRIVAAGAEVGEVQQLGHEWSLFFRDVDGMELEVCAPAG